MCVPCSVGQATGRQTTATVADPAYRLSPCVRVSSVAAFAPRRQSWVVVTETCGLQSLTIPYPGPHRESLMSQVADFCK